MLLIVALVNSIDIDVDVVDSQTGVIVITPMVKAHSSVITPSVVGGFATTAMSPFVLHRLWYL